MTASENSFLGFAKQVAKGTPNTTDADFDYLLFREGGLGVQNMTIPLDKEIGGGAMLRNVLKVGVMGGGQLSFIPRPKTLGSIFLGITGAVASVDGLDGSYEHEFTISDQFSAPWFTFRNSPGGLLGEQYADARFASLTLAWRAARFVEGQLAIQSAATPGVVSTAAWNAASKVDGGPQFIAPLGTIELPAGVGANVTAGAFTAGLAMPIDEQMIVGSYNPKNLSIVDRAYALTMALLIEDATLYKKMTYDPAGGNAWVASIMREADFTLQFQSDVEAATGKPYQFSIAANGASDETANVAWSCRPISLKAGRQVQLAVTGTFLADSAGNTPITLGLVNQEASY